MIFVTVGAQMSFDRLIEWVDDWAEQESRSDIVAQIGPSSYAPRHLKVLPFMTPPEFRTRMMEADLIIAHAGMGSIINALELAKPILVVPRLCARDETRNDHQVATAQRLAAEGLVRVAHSAEELAREIQRIETEAQTVSIASTAQSSLLQRLRDFAAC